MSAHPSNCSLHRIALVLLLVLGVSSIDGEAAANDMTWLGDVRFMAYTPSEFRNAFTRRWMD